jgi:kinesin family protein 4/21/27
VKLQVGYLEIYNEEVRDLLHPHIASKDINVRELKGGRIVVQGALEEPVYSIDDVKRWFQIGNVHRSGSRDWIDGSTPPHRLFCAEPQGPRA